MSYDITLIRSDGKVADVPRHYEGGTFALGGSESAELNVTYNYAPLFNFRGLDGRQARDTAAEMERAVADLGTERDLDYWNATPGNAGYAVSILLAWAVQHPYATWRVE